MSSSPDPVPSAASLAVLCSPEGSIVAGFVDDLGIVPSSDAALHDLFVPECRDKADAFLEELRLHRSAFGWELNIETPRGPRSLQFAGSASAQEILVVGGRSASELVRVYGELQKSGDPRLVAFRQHLDRDIDARESREARASELYDALSSVNNELANSQRTLARRSIELERMTSEKDATLSELLRLKEHLEERVSERTRQLEESNRELESFSYSVSHDLRAPLRHISGFADLLLKGNSQNLTDQQRRYVEVISESIKEAGLLVDDLLSFARMGRTELMTRDVDTRDLVDSLVSEFSADTTARGITWKIDRHLPAVSADRAMLRLAIRNLLANAVKYTSRQVAPVIEIGTRRAAELNEAARAQDQEIPPHHIVFFVRDNGIGFEMQYVGKLFGVFQRLHRAEEYPGTGIGLASVRRIIRRHGGRTWAEGVPNEGATFYFSLPPAGEVSSA
jgi:signal transduction histidine kinase